MRDNILGFSSLDSEWYNTVIDAVALRSDFATFSQGDQTIVGTNGITLSGGQKQRVAIARAVYARKPLTVFDDVLSGLDVTTARHVFDNVFGREGLLRGQRSTVVLCTHSVNVLPKADHVISLGSGGHVFEQGIFEHLNEARGYIQSLSVSVGRQAEKTGAETSTTDIKDANKTVTSAQPSTVGIIQERNRRLGDFSMYRYYFQTVGTAATVIFVFLAISFAFFIAFPTVWLKWWADKNTRNELVTWKDDIVYNLVYGILQLLGLASLTLYAAHTWGTIIPKSGKKLHWIALQTVMTAPMDYFNKTDTRVTTNLFSQDLQLIDWELPTALLNLASNFFMCWRGGDGHDGFAVGWIGLPRSCNCVPCVAEVVFEDITAAAVFGFRG